MHGQMPFPVIDDKNIPRADFINFSADDIVSRPAFYPVQFKTVMAVQGLLLLCDIENLNPAASSN